MKKLPPKAVFISFFGVVVLVGAVVAGLGVHRMWAADRSASWPKASGVVLESRVATHRTGKRRSSVRYIPEVRYEYAVEGRTYAGTRVSFATTGSEDPADAQRVIRNYPVGVRVAAWYDPDEPGESVLEPGSAVGGEIVVAFGLVFVAFGLAAVWFFNREHRRMAAPPPLANRAGDGSGAVPSDRSP